MSGASGTALEWALALLRAPGERHALRQRPLPPGIDALLAQAADAAPDALREAAQTLGEPEARIREAAQFFAREVLFHPQADAYRTLGVAEDASSEEIKTHHRLLQLWLHPDRQRSEDDSVFASRVNIAWNRLRTEERRRNYDVLLAEERAAQAAIPEQAVPMARPAAAWIPVSHVEESGGRWRQRAPVLALLGVCVVLGWLTIRNDGRQPEAWDWQQKEGQAVAEVDAAPAAPPAEPRSDASAPPRPPKPAQAPAVARAVPVSQPAPGPALGSQPLQAPPKVPAKDAAVRVASKPAPVREPAMAAARPVAAAMRAADTPTRSVAVKVPARPASPAAADTKSIGKPSAPVAKTAAAPPPKRDDKRTAQAARTVAAAPASGRTSKSETAAPATGKTTKPAPARNRRPAAPTMAAVAPARTAPAAAAATATAAPAAERTPPASVAPDFARVAQARQVGDDLLGYFRKPRRKPPPIWNSPAIMSSANGMRAELHARGQGRLDEPRWRIDAASATMTAAYHGRGDAEEASGGVLTVDMVWRENRWLVTGLSMESGR